MRKQYIALCGELAGKIEGRIEGTEDDEKDVSSYWKALRKREGTGN